MDKVAKLKCRLNSALACGQFYEAHQISRTMHARLLAESKYSELLELLHSTCTILCEGKEFTSAIDLAELFVDTLKKGGCTLDEQKFDQILALFSQLPAKLESDNPESHTDRRTPFLNKTLDWALKSADGQSNLLRGCAHLHQKFADIFLDEGHEELSERYARAADYLLAEVERLTSRPPPAEEAQDEAKIAEEGLDKRLNSDIDLD